MTIPFYDPHQTYDKNYEDGPFGAFANKDIFKQSGQPQYNFLNQKVYLPFGIPAGPILNSSYAKAAFNKGFDIVVYKTVRSRFYPCHPFPNVLAVNISGKLSMKKLQRPLMISNNYNQPLSITNSFGVPSKKPEIWQSDVKKAITCARKGQVLVLSFMGTIREKQTEKEFIDDYILAAKLAHETGAKILEANLSCPNIGNEGLVCYNLEVTEKITRQIRKVIGNTPLILKIGHYADMKQLEALARIANEYADSIAAINTLQATVHDRVGRQALPGKNRLKSGICGASIKWAGVEMTKSLKAIKIKNNFSYSIEGVGGVMTADDYVDYKNAGADSVMSATGAMWNPYLAQDIKSHS